MKKMANTPAETSNAMSLLIILMNNKPTKMKDMNIEAGTMPIGSGLYVVKTFYSILLEFQAYLCQHQTFEHLTKAVLQLESIALWQYKQANKNQCTLNSQLTRNYSFW